MAGLTDAELFGNTSPQAPPPPKTTGLTDKELLSNNTSPQGGQEDNRSLMELLQAAGSSISNMTVDDVISYLEENGELPGGLGGAASGALIGFLSPVPGGALIGSIIGSAVGSGVGSMTSDVLMSEKEGTEALSDVAENLRKGGKFAMFKAIEPILRGVKLKDVPGTKGSAWYDKQLSFKNKGEIPPRS